jgi:hypothetical protein
VRSQHTAVIYVLIITMIIIMTDRSQQNKYQARVLSMKMTGLQDVDLCIPAEIDSRLSN